MAKFNVGDRVKVVKIPDDAPDYENDLGREGVVSDEPYDADGSTWVMVTLDGDSYESEFTVDEIAPAPLSTKVIEGVVAGDDCVVINPPNGELVDIRSYLPNNGDHVRITIEVLRKAGE